MVSVIPEKSKKAPRCRKIHGELPPELYLQLEAEAFQRGMTPYALNSAVMEAFLSGGLVQVPANDSESS